MILNRKSYGGSGLQRLGPELTTLWQVRLAVCAVVVSEVSQVAEGKD